MPTPLRVLLIEDSVDDAELVHIALTGGGYAPTVERVETAADMAAALERGGWDIVISDHNLPSFDAPAALRLMQEKALDLPFVIVSGVIGEETAVAAMKAGADDYVMKGNLARLSPAVDRARRDAAERARRAQLEDELRQAQKMEAVGRMAGGIAHDFKNILAAVSGYGELLAGHLADDPRAEYARQIVRAAARGTVMVQQLLAFGRRHELRPRVLELNGVVEDVRDMLHQLVGREVRFELHLDPSAGRVKVDPVQLQQVLLNLVVNARDAMEGQPGPVLTVATGCVDLDELAARLRPGLAPGRYATIEVRDTGHGMDAETQSRIFEPFFTTKPEGKGTGLGLSTAYGTVTQSGGRIEVRSSPGQGATFTVLLPQTLEEPTPA